MSNGGKPKPTFYVAVIAVVVALLGLAVWRCTAKKSDEPAGGKAGTGEFKDPRKDPSLATTGDCAGPEACDKAADLTEKTYEYEPAKVLDAVPGTADFKSLGKDRVVRLAINIWAGWAPIIWANQGKGPGKVWKDAEGKDFKLELVLIDNPVDMVNTFAAGDVHLGWATVDMLPLIVQRLNRDPRTMPRIFQQIDWSNGGDGIVVRGDIAQIGDLRGKKVVLAQNSPSHYFLLNMLLNAGVQPAEVEMKFTQNAFQAAQAFNSDKSYAAVVSWAPDIYKLADVKGNKLLITTKEANKLIADVWFARADFARDNPAIVEGLVRGIFDAMVELKADENKQKVGPMMDETYDLPPGSGSGMLADAHWTNFAENRNFFMNQNNPTNFERTYNTAFLLFKSVGVVNAKVNFDKIMDFSVLKKLGAEPKYADQVDEYQVQFTPVSASGINVESAVLTKTVVINFFPNSFDPYHQVEPQTKVEGGAAKVPYDPNAKYTIEQIAKLAGQFGAARIQIEGHTDSSMKSHGADERLVRELSLNRANAVKEQLVREYKLDPNQFVVAGFGWDKPADPNDQNNQQKNRRVEVKVIPAEAQ